MSAPFYKLDYFSYDWSLLIAFIIGIAFGFFLERGGLGSATKLAKQFYLTDLTVFKVMFTAIITAMLGLFWLTWFNVLDLELVYVNPTYLMPQLIGGLVFGVGFVIGGLCPGTACVASATGRLDGLALIAGMFSGIFIFGEVFESFYDFLYSTSMAQITLPEFLNVSHGLLLLLVVFMAMGAFIGAGAIEKRFARRDQPVSDNLLKGKPLTIKALAGLALTLAVFAAAAGNPRSMRIAQMENSKLKTDENINFVDAAQLANWIMEKRDDFVLVDMRSQNEFDEYHIPFALIVPEGRFIEEKQVESKKIVYYAGDQIEQVELGSSMKVRVGENVFFLDGGLTSWMKEVIFPDLSFYTNEDSAQVEKIIKMSRYFGGRPKYIGVFKKRTSRKYLREGC